MDVHRGAVNSLVLEDPSGSRVVQNRRVRQQNTAAEYPARLEEAQPETEEAQVQARSREVQEVAGELERISLAFNKRLKFNVDYKSHEVTVKVIDPETDKVIRELPSQELQKLRDKIREAIGLLFDEQV